MIRALAIACLLAAPAAAQEFFALKGHGGPIMDVAVSPSGQIATASFDNSVGLWTGQTPHWFDGHEAAVNTVHFAQGSLLLSGGDDFVARAWEIATNTAFEIGRHKGKIAAITASPTGQFVATASWDGTIGLWPVPSATQEIAPASERFLEGHSQGVNDVVFSQNGTRLYSASIDGTVRIWDVTSGQEKQVLIKHGFGVNKLILNEADGWLAYGAVDGGTRLIDLQTGNEIADFTLDRRPILALAFHPGTRQLAVGDGEGYIMVIDTAALRIARDFRATQHGPVWALAFSPDGQNIHAAGIEDILYSWPVETMDQHGPMATTTRSFLEDPSTLTNGERQFKRKCSICHTVTQGSARKAGPSLFRLFGRRAGTVPDYTYSDTLLSSDIIWSAETINDLFDLGPDQYINGTKMPVQRIAKQQDRNDLIDYLSRVTAGGEN